MIQQDVVNDGDITKGIFNAILSGLISTDDVNSVSAEVSGVVTATLTTGNLASFSSLNTASTDLITVNVSDAGGSTLAATDLSTLGGKTAGVVTVQNAVTISGTSAELMAALVTAETKVITASANITFTDAPSLAQFAAIDAATGGTLNYTSIADQLSALVTDAGLGNSAVAYNKPITVTDTGTVSAASLSLVSLNTNQTVTATAASTISGTAAQLLAVVADTGIATATNYNAVVTGVIGVSDISSIDNDTTGTVTVADVTDTLTAIQTFNGASAANAAILQNATGTITANGDANPDTIDLSAVLKGITINGLAGADALTGTNFADVITGGRDADSLLGKGGADTFYFATGDAPTSGVGAATYDRINDFAIAQDKIDLQVAPVLGAAETNNAANIGGVTGSAAIDAAGKVTFSGAGVDDLTLAEALVAVRSLVTGAGEIAFFEINDGSGGSYLYQENGSAANDTFIFLAGTTGIVDTSGIAGDSNTLFIV